VPENTVNEFAWCSLSNTHTITTGGVVLAAARSSLASAHRVIARVHPRSKGGFTPTERLENSQAAQSCWTIVSGIPGGTLWAITNTGTSRRRRHRSDRLQVRRSTIAGSGCGKVGE
jgi:hypothetical protein